LIRPRIESSCPKGGVVLDPFSGTGRTLIVALTTGRSAVGFDIVPEYVEVSRKACEAVVLHDGQP
jgi:site-specific DNA-methyltransferase (adenine-specific)